MDKINSCIKTLNMFKNKPSICLSSSLKKQIESALLDKKFSHSNYIISTAADLHDSMSKYKNLEYQIAWVKSTTYTKPKNLKYGLIGLSFMLFFGSVTLSIHPVFFGGVAIGFVLYRKVANQSAKQVELTNQLESFTLESKALNNKIKQQAEQLEMELKRLSASEFGKEITDAKVQ